MLSLELRKLGFQDRKRILDTASQLQFPFHVLIIQSCNMTIFEFRQNAVNLLATGQSLVDRIIAPSTRKQAYANVGTFAKEQPLLAVGSSNFYVELRCRC
jgi:hypothetical protein